MARNTEFIRQVDKSVGAKIHELRLAKGLSRQQLADTIDVTHQQLQKYEKGINKVSLGRLALIAKSLEEELSYFYSNINDINHKPVKDYHQRMCIELSRNFMEIDNPEYQKSINILVKTLAKKN